MTVNGRQQPTFKAVCSELGLLQDDGEWALVLQEASFLQHSRRARNLFVTILMFCQPSNPVELFNTYYHDWYDDYAEQLPAQDNDHMLRLMVLADIERQLHGFGKSLSDFGLPALTAEDYYLIRGDNRQVREDSILIQEEVSYSYAEMLQTVHNRLHGDQQFLPEQRHIYDSAMHAVQNMIQAAFFIDAPGGSGKTTTLNALLAAVRTLNNDEVQPQIALAVATSGIAATLMHGGRTFHSRFKGPLTPTETSSCSIPLQSDLAELIRRARIIVWDEAPMGHRFILEAFERVLRDIMNSHEPFGGKAVVLAGDFRQLLPVIPNGSRAEIVSSTMKASLLWEYFQVFRLHRNMRLRNQNDPEVINYSNWLMRIGNGTYPHGQQDDIVVPTGMLEIINIDDEDNLDDAKNQLIHWCYPNLADRHNDNEWMSKRAILATTNVTVDDFNRTVTEQFPGVAWSCGSADRVTNDNDAIHIPIEFLNHLNPSGLPPHYLYLKRVMPLLLLRNICPSKGLCNGTKLILNAVHNDKLIEATITNNDHAGEVVYIPRITLSPKDGQFTFDWTRRQFPVRPAFAMTINKSQGQTLQRVALWLEQPVFSHGQLYVALSRVGHPSNVCMALSKTTTEENTTRNIVYDEIL